MAQFETVEEFLARGGEIANLPSNPVPRVRAWAYGNNRTCHTAKIQRKSFQQHSSRFGKDHACMEERNTVGETGLPGPNIKNPPICTLSLKETDHV